MSEEIYVGLTQERLGTLYDSSLENDYPIYEIQKTDKVIGGPYIPEIYEDPDVNPELAQEPVPVNNRQAYDLGLRDAYINDKLNTSFDNLQQQINNINVRSDVVDVVANYAALMAYDTRDLTINDVIKVLQDETQQYKCTYYRFMGQSANPVWVLIGSERTTLPQIINVDTDPISPSDNTFYVVTGSGLNLTLATSGTGVAYYQGMEIEFLGINDFNLTYNTNQTEAVKANQVYSLVYNGTAWVERQANAINSNVNQPYKTFKGAGNYVYYYDGSNITSTYDIPSDKCAVFIAWENSTNASALIIDQLTGKVYVKNLNNSSTWGSTTQLSNDADVVHIAGNGTTPEEVTGIKDFSYGHSSAQDDNNPSVRAARLRITGQVTTDTTKKSVSQVDFYLGDEPVAYMGCTRQNGNTYVKVASNDDNTPLIFGYKPFQDNTACIRFEKNKPVWRGGQTGIYNADKALAVVGDIKDGTYTLTNKTISKKANMIKEDVVLVTENASLNFTENTNPDYFIGKDVQYYLNGSSAVTMTLPNLTGTNIQRFSGLTKTFTSDSRDNTIVFYNGSGTSQTITLGAGETQSFKSCYDYTNNRIYWKKDVSDPDPVIVTTTGNTGEVVYDNSNQIVAAQNVVLTLGSGDKQGREVSITFLYDGTLVYTDQDGVQQSESVSANTVSKFKWTGTGWIYETQKNSGTTVISEVPLIPRLSSNTDQGFTLRPSSQLANYEAYKAFSDHPIMYNVGSTVMYDPTSFATINDGNNGYLEVIHPSIVTRYKYLHIIDRGSGSNNYPNTVTDDGITEYTISGTQDGGSTWTSLTTFTKEPEETDVIIPLETQDIYNGFKIATTGTFGASRNVGFRKVQMYVPAKTTIQEITEDTNNISAYTPLVPMMTSNSERGFELAQSSTKTNCEAFHAFNQHAITYYIGANGIVSLESSATNGDGNNSWISCTHNGFKVPYGYLHLVDRGTAGANPEVVADNGITQYRILGYRNGAWEEITTFSKSASDTDVKIPLNTNNEYYGFKIATIGVVGTTNEIGWRHIQMYVPNTQKIKYVEEVDPDPTIISQSVHTGLCTYYNKVFAVNTAGQTLTIDNADKIGREITIIPNASVTIAYNDKSGNPQTVVLAQNQLSYMVWNGTGWFLKTFVEFQGPNRNGTDFNYNMNVTI